MSNSVWPHRQQPTRLPRPWDSPGKNTGVGCHFLLHYMKVKRESEVAQSCLTLSDPMDCSLPGSSVHGIFQARVVEWGAIAFSDEDVKPHAKVVMQLKSEFPPLISLSSQDLIRLPVLWFLHQSQTHTWLDQCHLGFWAPSPPKAHFLPNALLNS